MSEKPVTEVSPTSPVGYETLNYEIRIAENVNGLTVYQIRNKVHGVVEAEGFEMHMVMEKMHELQLKLDVQVRRHYPPLSLVGDINEQRETRIH